jgi:hypothetical protein
MTETDQPLVLKEQEYSRSIRQLSKVITLSFQLPGFRGKNIGVLDLYSR